MSLRMILGLVVLLGARRARADRAVVVDVDARAPFAAGELEAALRVRVGASGDAVRVRVVATDGGVIVSARGGSQAVALDGRAGADAARLVALVAVDLMLDDLAIAPDPLPAPPGMIAARVAAPTPSRGVSPEPITVGLLGGAAQWSGVMAGATVDVAIPRGRWILAFDVGGGELVAGGLSLTGATVRLGGGARFGWLDLRGGVTLSPIVVTDGAGDRTLLAGVGASARVRVPVTERVRAVVAAGADAYATHTDYRMEGMTLTSTPWFAPWIAAGMEVTP